jgi:hypothetical protein
MGVIRNLRRDGLTDGLKHVSFANKCSDNEQKAGVVSDAKSVVQSAAKIFAVLRAFGVNRPELTISDVARLAALYRGRSA